MRTSKLCRELLAIVMMTTCGAALTLSQQISSTDRDLARTMLANVSNDVKKHYYDPKLRGVDWDAVVRETQDKIDHSQNLNAAMSYVAGALGSLNDSHTFLLPPPRPFWIDFGYQMDIIGDECFVTRVRSQSDADTKGLKAGDEVQSVNGFAPNRMNLWTMEYVFYTLRPQPQMDFEVTSPEGQQKHIIVEPRVQRLKPVDDFTDIWQELREAEDAEHFFRLRSAELSDELMIVKIPIFDFSDSQIGDLLTKARKHKSLIIDLRGNGGGAEDALRTLLGEVFDHDVKIGDLVSRTNRKPLEVKSKGKNAFTGKLVVLIDSRSASASELFARVVQLEKRGTVVGDQSSGSVMEAEHYSHSVLISGGTGTHFGASITSADIVMSDGNSLEQRGVVPDESVTPTAADLAMNRDPVLARAAEIAGVSLDSVRAGSLFPFEWAKN